MKLRQLAIPLHVAGQNVRTNIDIAVDFATHVAI